MDRNRSAITDRNGRGLAVTVRQSGYRHEIVPSTCRSTPNSNGMAERADLPGSHKVGVSTSIGCDTPKAVPN